MSKTHFRSVFRSQFLDWCRRRDSNPHGVNSPPDPESGVSASSTTSAFLKSESIYHNTIKWSVNLFVLKLPSQVLCILQAQWTKAEKKEIKGGMVIKRRFD